MQDEAAARKFAEPEARKQIAALINKAKDYEARAVELLKEIVDIL